MKQTGTLAGFASVFLLAVTLGLPMVACSTNVAQVGPRVEREGPPGFDQGDAGDLPPAQQLMCATSACPPGTATCENSRERCDADLLNDRNNCGACGAACTPDSLNIRFGPTPTLQAAFLCVSGECKMFCQYGYADCDGIPDNGCETRLNDHENCGGCGVQCAADEPCVDELRSGVGVCGCTHPKSLCSNSFCTDLASDNYNCGECGHACEDPAAPPPEFHATMACQERTCKRACEGEYGDCDQDFEENGCEQYLGDNNNCGACGNVCPSGVQCEKIDQTFQCGCPPGYKKCGAPGWYTCRDILSDPKNCGGCDLVCQSGDPNAPVTTNVSVCRGGVCDILCKNGRADCNGSAGDGCEIDLQTDPQNCGACGHECDLTIGQPCVRGECAVAACGGGESR